jgi:hypothetical protein
MRAFPRPRMLKSHESFQPQYPRVIYTVRDPSDVAISFYAHNLKAGNIWDDYLMEAFVPRFIEPEFDKNSAWRDNIVSWITLTASTWIDPDFFAARARYCQSLGAGTGR